MRGTASRLDDDMLLYECTAVPPPLHSPEDPYCVPMYGVNKNMWVSAPDARELCGAPRTSAWKEHPGQRVEGLARNSRWYSLGELPSVWHHYNPDAPVVMNVFHTIVAHVQAAFVATGTFGGLEPVPSEPEPPQVLESDRNRILEELRATLNAQAKQERAAAMEHLRAYEAEQRAVIEERLRVHEAEQRHCIDGELERKRIGSLERLRVHEQEQRARIGAELEHERGASLKRMREHEEETIARFTQRMRGLRDRAFNQ